MSLTITLPPDVERSLAELAGEHGKRAEEYATEMLRVAIRIAAKRSVDEDSETGDLTDAQRAQALEHLIDDVRRCPPGTHFVDDSRDSIYDGPDGRGHW